MVHWYKRDPEAAHFGMIALTLEEKGAYNDIIDLLYARDGNVPDDDIFLSRHLGCRPQTWRRLRARLMTLGKIWIKVPGKIDAKRVANELETAHKRIAQMRVLNEKRWNNNNTKHPVPEVTTTTTTTKKEYTLANGVKIPLSNGHSRKKENPTTNDDDFMQFWIAYPRKEAKKAARVAFDRAIKEVPLTRILAALERQKRLWTDPKYIPHPATWLNQGRWDDEPIRSEQGEFSGIT